MFKVIATTAALALSSTAATAATIETFDLNIATAAGTDSTAVLAAGVEYRLTVSGTFNVGNNLPRHLTDAEYFDITGADGGPFDTAGSFEIGVGVDGMDVDFGAFNPDNIYTTTIIGADSTINVFFADTNYGDNVGSLQVKISAVPLPAGALLLLTGLAGLGLARRKS